MPKISKGMRKKREKTLDPKDFRKFEEWLKGRSPVWSLIIASRAALRVLPLLAGTKDVSEAMLPIFRAVSIARYASIYSTYQIQWDLIRSAAAGVRAFHLS